MKKILSGFLLLAAMAGMSFIYLYKSPAEKTFQSTQLLAKQGGVDAQKSLAEMYLNGVGVKADTQAALDLYSKAAAGGDAASAYTLAELYIVGKKVPQDLVAAVAYLKAAAVQGEASAQYELGRFYKEGLAHLNPNASQAAFWWMKAKAAGHGEADAALRDVELETPELYAQVKNLFYAEQQAKKSSASDQLIMAKAYHSGDVLEKDAEAAFYWYHLAKEAQIPAGLYELGSLYEQGDGVAQDKAKALELYTQAAEAGYVPAEYALGKEAYTQASSQEKPDYSVAFAWLNRAAQAGHAEAQYMQGVLYMQGQGTEQSIPLAVDSFRKAAEQGHAAAQYVLGQSYYKGLGVKQNGQTAQKWLKLSAENGNALAKAFLEKVESF